MFRYKTPAKWRSQNNFLIASDFMLKVLVVGRFATIVAFEIAATKPVLRWTWQTPTASSRVHPRNFNARQKEKPRSQPGREVFMDTTLDTNTRSGRLVRKNGILYRECNGRYEDSDMPTGNPHIPFFKVWVVDMVPVEEAEIQRPRCEHKGSVPHPATCVLVWELLSGRVAKYFCDEHSRDASLQPYFLSKLVGYHERAKAATEEE